MKEHPSVSRLLVAVAVALLLVSAASVAIAAPLTFIWSPASTTPPLNASSNIGPANNFNVADFASITNTGGGFTEVGYLSVLQFLNGGSPAPDGGLGTTYSLYIGFNGAGTPIPPPPPGQANTGNFTALQYTIFANPAPTPTFTVSNGNVAVSGNAGAFPLAYGTLITGTATLTNTNNGTSQPFSPTANVFASFNVCTAAGQGNTGFGQALCTANESAFFVVPPPGTINLLVGNFSATTSVTTFDPPFTFLNINGGGGNLTLENRVPEPASLLLLGVGVLGLGVFGGRRWTSR